MRSLWLALAALVQMRVYERADPRVVVRRELLVDPVPRGQRERAGRHLVVRADEELHLAVLILRIRGEQSAQLREIVGRDVVLRDDDTAMLEVVNGDLVR